MVRRIFWALACLALFAGLVFLWMVPLSKCGVWEAERNYRSSVPLQVCAGNGDTEAMAWLGIIILANADGGPPYGDSLFLMNSRSTEEMTQKGLSLLERAAERGSAVAANEVANFHRYGGYGYDIDGALAEATYEASLANGDSMAAYNLAWMHAEGAVIKPDYAESVRYLRLSAEMGYEVARCALDDMRAEASSGNEHADLRALQSIVERSYPQDCLTEPYDAEVHGVERYFSD